jgi:hypothetical protein
MSGANRRESVTVLENVVPPLKSGDTLGCGERTFLAAAMIAGVDWNRSIIRFTNCIVGRRASDAVFPPLFD